ncbi:protein kinase subdomain-containing protein PKL/CAK/Fmp29 [Roridomyces roridus]|uniref:Protein kinase subdomain-containing protein PKL/CAK/Fmp29 n=1 Tax=Roridomyces roridus TaxID=1738132 RepID=A0AAD7CKC0_9AGAR|nr:protein kinase subdomain-containing protein PKL/CAK/Fmp29 [Roridomyces roridus]
MLVLRRVPWRSLPLHSPHPSTRSSVRGWRASSSSSQSESSDLFEFTNGNYLVSSALRLAERKVVFNVAELSRLAAQSVNRSPDEVASVTKNCETVYDRTIIITMRDGFKMEAHIPYHCTLPRYFATASKAATMAFLRTHGIPAPQVYGYAPDANNAAGTEYIFTESLRHNERLVDQWFYLEEADIISVARQLAQLESKMMSIPFPAGGALYYTDDLERVGAPHVPLPEDARFAVGPDSRPALWLGERAGMDVHRGPYKDAEATLLGPAENEITYLTQFGRPQLPVERIKRVAYKHVEQNPAEHIETLTRYRLLAPSLIPKDPDLARFCIRHRNVHFDNILVSRSSDGTLNIAAVIDWYYTAIRPVFLLSYMPYGFGDWTVPLSQVMSTPSNFDKSTDPGAEERRGDYQRRPVNHHYLEEVEKHNPLLYRCLEDSSVKIRHQLFWAAGKEWQADPIPLKIGLIEAATSWKSLRADDRAPCPIRFDMEEMCKTILQYQHGVKVMSEMSQLQLMCNISTNNYVDKCDFEAAVERGRILKQNALLDALRGDGQGMFPELIKDWPLDDFDEEGKVIGS